MTQWASEDLGNKGGCSLSYLERNTSSRKPPAENANQIVKGMPESIYKIKTKPRPKKTRSRCLGDVGPQKRFSSLTLKKISAGIR